MRQEVTGAQVTGDRCVGNAVHPWRRFAGTTGKLREEKRLARVMSKRQWGADYRAAVKENSL
jgi:hypothetical protein